MKQKDLLILLVPVFLIILSWIGFSVYHASVKSKIGIDINAKVIPINPTFNQTVIDEIKKRKHVAQTSDLTGIGIPLSSQSAAVVTPTLTPKPTILQSSPSPSAAPATQAGTLRL